MATGSVVVEKHGGALANVTSFPAHILWTKQPDKSADRFTTATGYHVRSPPLTSPRPPSTDQSRTFRLERNLRYLKSEHQSMLIKLYEEIEILRRRNRELQYELIIGKPLVNSLDDGTQPIEKVGPVSSKPAILIVRDTSTQTSVGDQFATDNRNRRLSHMEGELTSLRMALEDAETRNTSLSTLVSQLKKSHMKINSRSAHLVHEASIVYAQNSKWPNDLQVLPASSSHTFKSNEYEDRICQLKRENAEQRNELMQVRTCLNTYRAAAAMRQRERSVTRRESLPHVLIPLKSPPPRPKQARNKTIELPYIIQPTVSTIVDQSYDDSGSTDSPFWFNQDRSSRHHHHHHHRMTSDRRQSHRRSRTPPQLTGRRKEYRKSNERVDEFSPSRF